jgi:hypothetical protein
MSTELMQVTSNRQALLESLKIKDDGTTSLTKLIKEHLVSLGFAKSELKEELSRILKGETVQNHIDKEIGSANRAGWTREIRYGKPSVKDGKVRQIVVTYKEPAAAKVKPLSRSQEERMIELAGGANSAQAKQFIELMKKGGMLKEEVIDVASEVTQVPDPEVPAEATTSK